MITILYIKAVKNVFNKNKTIFLYTKQHMKSPFYATVPNTTALVFTFEIKDMYCSKVLFYIIIYYYKYVIIIKKKDKIH